MSSKSEWTAVHEQMIEEERQRLGPPPTAEELAAYENGELSPEDEERVRALLVCYPALARTLVSQPEPDIPRPGEADFLSGDELTNDWKALQKRIHGGGTGGGRVLQFWRISAAIAATLAVVFGGLFWRARSELGQPAIAYEYVLTSDTVRGPGEGPRKVSPIGGHVLLTIQKDGERGIDYYRVDIRRSASAPNRRVWSGRAEPTDQQFVTIVVPSRFLKAGSYTVELYGVRKDSEERLATYPFRVER